MTPQYTYDNNGNPIGVFITISDWNTITERYSGIEELPQWKKDFIDQRLDYIKNHPEELTPLEDFMTELERDDEI